MKLTNVHTRMAPASSMRSGKTASSARPVQRAHETEACNGEDQSRECLQFTASGWAYNAAKRCFDVVFSLAVIICSLPLTLLVALAVKLDSKGPVFFSQQRVGKGGKLFTIHKFRTMYTYTPVYACTPKDDCQDERVTRVGRFLRQSGMDELPQFFNVLCGDMSVVGPRPEMPFLVESYTERQRLRLCVLPGITGPWQLSAARSLPISESLHFDEEYMQRRSMGYDMLLVARTFLLTLRLVVRAMVPPVCRREGRRDAAGQ